MSNTKHTGEIQATYFAWRLRVRNEVWYADGRKAGLGKHSLGTKNYDDAIEQLRQLDRRMAGIRGVIPLQAETTTPEVTVADGWTKFFANRGRPQLMGGVAPSTLTRYRPIRDKHIKFCEQRSIKYWSQVDKARTEEFGVWLAEKSADRTLKLELELITSVVRYLVEEKLLPANQCFTLRLSKPQGSDTYCYRREEVVEMIEHCRRTSGLDWFADVIIGLATTGLRSEEFNRLRWSEIDLDAGVLRLRDQRHSGRKKMLANIRTIKGKRDRVLPINPAFREVVERQPRHPDGFVFHGPRGGRLHARNNLEVLQSQVIMPLKTMFPTAPGEVGFEHGVIHSFRHFFCSEAFRNGATEAEVLDWLGDRDSQMIYIYRHLRPDDSKRKMNEIDFVGTGTLSAPRLMTIPGAANDQQRAS